MSEQRPLLVRAPAAPGASLPAESPQAAGAVPLSQYLWILKRRRHFHPAG